MGNKFTMITEEEAKRIVKRLARRIGEKKPVEPKPKSVEPKKSLHDEILDYLEPYINAGCVEFNATGKYIIVNVGAPYDFVDGGFEREDANRVKGKLRAKGFFSLGVGEYAIAR